MDPQFKELTLLSTDWADEHTPLREAQEALSQANTELYKMLIDFAKVMPPESLNAIRDQLRADREKSLTHFPNLHPDRLGACCERYLDALTNHDNEKSTVRSVNELPRLAYTQHGIEQFWEAGVWKALLKAFSSGFWQIIEPRGDVTEDVARERRKVWTEHWKMLKVAAYRLAMVEFEDPQAVRFRSKVLDQFAQPLGH